MLHGVLGFWGFGVLVGIELSRIGGEVGCLVEWTSGRAGESVDAYVVLVVGSLV